MHIVQRGGRYPKPGDIQEQIGWGSDQSGIVQDIPDCCRVGGLRSLGRVRSNPKESVSYDSVNCH